MKELQRKSNFALLLAIALIITSVFFIVPLAKQIENIELGYFGIAMIISGVIAWFMALSNYAQSKGYSGVWCLLGFLSLPGLLVLLLLPDISVKPKLPAPTTYRW